MNLRSSHRWNGQSISFSVIINLSNYPEDYFPGRFNITSVRLTATLPAGYAIIYTGRHPTFITSAGVYEDEVLHVQKHPLRHRMPEDYELDDLPGHHPQMRACAVLYPSLKFTKFNITKVQDERIPNQALTAFGTQRNLQEYRMRYFMKKTYDGLEDESEFNRDLDYWRKDFKWYDERDDQNVGFGWYDVDGN
jgi:hypothetical protein